jgi:hypothetical protein
MARPEVVSHWHKLLDDQQQSALDFYAAVEEELRRRELPGLRLERVDWHEGGVTSAKREYLRIGRDRLTFDLCAAPYGKGYFFSWWVAKQKSQYAGMLGYVGLIVVLAALGLFISKLGMMIGLIMFLIALLASMAGVEHASRAGNVQLEEVVQAIPGVGLMYNSFFKPATYYSLDSAIMFQESVSRAVGTVIANERNAQGLRALSPDEERPQIRDLLR